MSNARASVGPRLGEIADRLEMIDVERQALFAERLGLWVEGQHQGMNPVVLARYSRIKPVTVRTLLTRRVT